MTAEPAVERVVTVLAVNQCEEDHAWFRRVFSHSNWRIYEARSCDEALSLLRRRRVALVLCESVLPDGDWKQLLHSFSALPSPPLLIVTAEHPESSLWAEAINLGAYDVLSKPYDRAEATRVIGLAWLHWRGSLSAEDLP